jgi:hypothetical protein
VAPQPPHVTVARTHQIQNSYKVGVSCRWRGERRHGPVTRAGMTLLTTFLQRPAGACMHTGRNTMSEFRWRSESDPAHPEMGYMPTVPCLAKVLGDIWYIFKRGKGHPVAPTRLDLCHFNTRLSFEERRSPLNRSAARNPRKSKPNLLSLHVFTFMLHVASL